MLPKVERVNKSKLSLKTKDLLKKRRKLIRGGKRNSTEYVEINKFKKSRKSAKMDTIEHQTRQVEELIENNKGLKIFKKNNAQKKKIYKLKDKQGSMITDRKQIMKVVEHFYTDLYKSTISNKTNIQKKENNEKRIINVNLGS